MIQVTKCPLRISLAGGSTDLQGYLEKYGTGEVISFTPNLFTYIIMKISSDDHYKIVYSKVERVLQPEDIKNDIAREVLSYFKMPPVEVIFTADIPSSGSGLASSTSYLINLIKACLQFKKVEAPESFVGELAIRLERKFNPLTGYQDVWGCLVKGLKVLQFNVNGLSSNKVLSSEIFNNFDFFLIPTNSTRSSTSVLETINYEKVRSASYVTDGMKEAFIKKNFRKVLEFINSGWEEKKLTSPSICNEQTDAIEEELAKYSSVAARRLIGAGNGGYFLAVVEKGFELPLKKIKIDLYND